MLQAGETAGLVVGQRIVVDPLGTPEPFAIQAIDESTDTLTVTPAAGSVHNSGDAVVPSPKTTTAAVAAGGRVLALDDRMGIEEGTLLQVGVGAAAELVTVGSVPALTFVAPDPGNVTVFPGISQARLSGTPVAVVGAATPVAGRQATALALPAVQGATHLYVTDGDAFVAGEIVRLTLGGTVTYHTLTANATPLTGAGALAADRPLMLTLQTALGARPSRGLDGRRPQPRRRRASARRGHLGQPCAHQRRRRDARPRQHHARHVRESRRRSGSRRRRVCRRAPCSSCSTPTVSSVTRSRSRA